MRQPDDPLNIPPVSGRMRHRLLGGVLIALVGASPAFADETITYRYDVLGRVVAAAHSGTVNTGVKSNYTYDAADNRAVVTVQGSTNDSGSVFPAAANPHTDFNGDGRDDILWRNDDGRLSDWLSTSTGTATDNYANTGNAVSNVWHVAATGDFNGDGRDDILWRHDNGTLVNWLAQTNGGFADNSGNFTAGIPNAWHVVATGDFNGDGKADLLWRNDSGEMSDWLGQSNGNIIENNANAYQSVPTSWHIVGTGDFNGDGKWDILWRNDSGVLKDWLGQSSGGFVDNAANSQVTVPTNWKVIGTGDFNGDGKADILWRSSSGEFTNWLGQSNGGFAGNDPNAYRSSTPTGWHIIRTGDFNGDGRDDIYWRNDDGMVGNWLATSSGGWTVNGSANTPVSQDWHIVPGEMPW